jgi:protein phosphatase methylesterase 1
VYLKGSAGPVLLLLHGGGHSALSWAVFSVSVSKLVECRIAAMDIRGHGNTATENDADLSASTLLSDVQTVAESLYRDESPPIILMGHSMGGAIAVHVAAKLTIPSLIGLAVIDVVEGTAMDSLGANHAFLSNRPSSFRSLEHAIEWSIRSGQLRNVQSARVSVPGQVMKSNGVGSNSVTSPDESVDSERHSKATARGPLTTPPIAEEGEGSGGGRDEEEVSSDKDDHESISKSGNKELYVWRIDLAKTDPFWRGWFSGLTQLFLSCPLPKILIIAGVDRLDKEMTIAHMQGKFQMQVLSGCGHAVHEDAPDKVAEIVAGYLVRHRFSEAKKDFKM